VEKKFSFLTC